MYTNKYDNGNREKMAVKKRGKMNWTREKLIEKDCWNWAHGQTRRKWIKEGEEEKRRR